MRTIHKFLVPFASKSSAELPMPAHPHAPVRLAGIDPRSGQLAVWIEIDTEADPGPGRRMLAFPTGDRIPDGVTHVGSMIDGSFVWHIYELPR